VRLPEPLNRRSGSSPTSRSPTSRRQRAPSGSRFWCSPTAARVGGS